MRTVWSNFFAMQKKLLTSKRGEVEIAHHGSLLRTLGMEMSCLLKSSSLSGQVVAGCV